MLDVTVNDKEFEFRIEVVGRVVLLFPTTSEKRALVLTSDECLELCKKLTEAAKQAE